MNRGVKISKNMISNLLDLELTCLDSISLVERVQNGDEAAFEDLVQLYYRQVYNLALRLTDDPEDASDITQETFIKVYHHIRTFRGDAELKTWIYRITVNLSSNLKRWWKRRLRQHLQVQNSIETPERLLLRAEEQKIVQAALQKIKFEYRVAVILRDIEGLSYEQISETLGISVGTVKSRIARGREELRKLLKQTSASVPATLIPTGSKVCQGQQQTDYRTSEPMR